MKVAIQGIAGSFHAQAARDFFGDQAELINCAVFRDVFTAVKSGAADRGVVAIENSLHGPINPVYRLLADEHLWICGEVRLKIELFLIGKHAGEPLSSVQRVISQLPALEQCEQWLIKNTPKAVRQETSDTALSVQSVANGNEAEGTVAIASKLAASLHGGAILAGPINDDLENYTRFVVLAKEPISQTNANRTSIILTESSDAPGILFKALGYFERANINLSKLDSHPLPGEHRRYSFYIDFDASAESEAGKQILNQLRLDGWSVQLLGSYTAD